MLKHGFEPTFEDWRQEGILHLCATGIFIISGIVFPSFWIILTGIFSVFFIVRSFTWGSILALEVHKKRRLLGDYIQEVKAGSKTPTQPILRFYVLTWRFNPRREIPSSEIVHPFWRFSSLIYRLIAMREIPRFASFFQDHSYSSHQEEQEQYSYYQEPHSSSSQQEEEERFQRRQEQRRREEEQKQKSQEKGEDQSAHSCFTILGITPNADYATAKKAHRDLLKKYHPDRVNDLGPELQELATKKLKEINTAWEDFERHWKLKNS